MQRNQLFSAVAAVALTLSLTACDGDDGQDGAIGAQGTAGVDGAPGVNGVDANAAITLKFLGRTPAIAAQFDESAAEIVAYEPATKTAYLVNALAGAIDLVDLSEPSAPVITGQLDVAADVIANIAGTPALGAVNSVSIFGNTIAAAIEASPKQANGYVAFYHVDGSFLSAVEVGALPDMVSFTPDGQYVLTANEGEPNGDYSIDPEGSISIIDVSGGFTGLTAVTAGFERFTSDMLNGARFSARSASIAADMEPEYLTFSADSSTAFVTLQENNAVAIVDIAAGEISAIQGLGFKNYGLPGNEIDASNKDGGVNIRSWNVFGTYMPDALDSYTVNGTTYLVTANEGDGREYLTTEADADACTAAGGFEFDAGDCFHYLDEIRIKDIADTGATFAADLEAKLGANFTDSENLGRLKVITNLGVNGSCPTLATTGQPGADCEYENLYSYGARSFTIWDTETMRPVFDSGNDMEVITAQQLGDRFNASNDDNAGDDRSDDKGPEPESVEIAEINGNTYAFVGLERVGGVMVYNISNPNAATFVQYINQRDFSVDAEADVDVVGDLGPEGLLFVSADDSASGEPLLLVANEVSGTLAVYSISAL